MFVNIVTRMCLIQYNTSVISEDNNYGIATRDDFKVAVDQANKGHQKLTLNGKLRAELDPCVPLSFQVRLTLYDDLKIVDKYSIHGDARINGTSKFQFIFVLIILGDFSGTPV